MSSVVRSVLGAALLLTGASAAMAASDIPPVAGQPRQTGASTAVAASNNAPVADKSVQTGASTAVAASNNAPIADKSQKSLRPSVPDNNDPNGGNDPNSAAAARAFFVPQY
jgi:hypothetical protein